VITRDQIIPKCRNAEMIASRLSGGHGSSRREASYRLDATRTGKPQLDLTSAIQDVFGRKQYWFCTHCRISA